MAQDQSIEAAQIRIQQLVAEVVDLSKKELRSEEFFAQFLLRAVNACDAQGGAIWLVANASAEGKIDFQLAAQVHLESSLFQSDQVQRTQLLRVLSEVVQTRRPSSLAPALAQPGSLQAQLQQFQPNQNETIRAEGNQTPYPFIQVPIAFEKQVLGVLQVWLQPSVAAQNYGDFATFLGSLAGHIEQHFQSRRLGSLVLETQRLQHLLKFAGDTAGSLDPKEVAKLTANYGRDLIGCERCSLLLLRGEHWEVAAVSGQETVEPKSSMVKSMTAFVEAHAKPEWVVLRRKVLLPPVSTPAMDAEPVGSEIPTAVPEPRDVDLAFFELSQAASVAIAPLLDREKRLIGALFGESTGEHYFDSAPGAKEPPATARITEWIATHASRSWEAAEDYHSLPLLTLTRGLRGARRQITGPERRRFLLKWSVAAGLALGVALYPKKDRVDGACSLTAQHRAAVVSEVPGRIEKILVREGTALKKGDPIAQLDTRRIETDLAANEQEKLRIRADMERSRATGDESNARMAQLQINLTEQNEKKLRADLEAATLRSPIDGVVLTKEIELHTGEYLQPGVVFAEVANLGTWELQIEVNEKEIGRVEKGLQRERRTVPVHYILYSQSAHAMDAALKSRDQISASAYPKETENVFILTFRDLQIPGSLQSALRPGLTGRAKIELGRKPFFAIAWERIANWVQMRRIG
jgi:multidrug efflux pump subunit AcrA (membrane-fusion protein)